MQVRSATPVGEGAAGTGLLGCVCGGGWEQRATSGCPQGDPKEEELTKDLQKVSKDEFLLDRREKFHLTEAGSQVLGGQ